MTCLGYTRISSDGQTDNTSLANQRDRIVAFAVAHDLPSPEIVAETASGADPDRPGLGSLRARLVAGDTLVVLRLDRLYRSVVDGLPFFKEMEARGVAIRSVSEQIDTSTAMGRLMLTMILAFAAAERELIAERMATGRTRTAEAGGWNGGPVPYGYRRATTGDLDFIVEPGEAEIVRMLFKLYATGRYGLARLCKVTRCPLSPSAIGDVLASPFYLGMVRHDGIERPNRHEAIVSKVLFGRVQAVRGRRAANSPAARHRGIAGVVGE